MKNTLALWAALAAGCAAKTDELESQLSQAEDARRACEAEVARLKDKARDPDTWVAKRMETYQRMRARLEGAFADKATVRMNDGRLVLQFSSDILYASGSAELGPEGKAVLDTLAGVLIEDGKGREFLIAGHTDTDPLAPKSPYRSNWDLSADRAVRAVEYLVSKGVSPESLGATGYGEFEPIASNATPEGKASNRRTEVVFLPTPGENLPIPDAFK